MNSRVWCGVRIPALASAFGCFIVLAFGRDTHAAQLQEAEITQIIHDVQLLPEQATPRAAVVKDAVRKGTAVRTGSDSRTELTFGDQTLARMGANTIFSFNQGTRDLNLGSGVMLVHVPKGAGGAKIVTAGVTAGITGTTVMLEYHKDAFIKAIVLEGSMRMWLQNRVGESAVVRAGQMLVLNPNAVSMPDPVDVDLKKIMSTSLLIIDFPPLASEDLIAAEIRIQQDRNIGGQLIDPDTVVYGDDSVFPPRDPSLLDTLDEAIAAILPGVVPGGGGGGSEFGALQTITTPNPYVITSGTSIITAPTITTSGLTSQGKIYRGQSTDGSASQYVFGSTSAFDALTGFNAFGEGGSAFVPMAVFKFTNLQITGNPTIVIPSGGANNLAFISEGSITSGAPGGTLTFAGINNLLLATQNGQINLGPGVTFSGLNLLSMYARGAGSNIVLASPVTNVGSINLTAEGSVTVNGNESVGAFTSFAGTDFITGTGVITTTGFGISIHAENNLNFALGQFAVGAGSELILTAHNNINIDGSTNTAFFSDVKEAIVMAGNTLNFTGGTNLTWAPAGGTADFEAGAGGIQASTVSFFHPSHDIVMVSGGTINLKAIDGAFTMQAVGDINVNGGLSAFQRVSTGGQLMVGGNLTLIDDIFGVAQATGNITVSGTLMANTVSAGADVMANHIEVGNLSDPNGMGTATVTAAGMGINPFVPGGPTFGHLWTVNTVQSHTAPVGLDFSGNNYSTPGSNGGILVLNAITQTFSAADGINNANFDGGDAAPVPGTSPGNGGSFTLNAGSVSLTNATISATTGIIDSNAMPAGTGGTVSLNAQTQVVMQNSTIKVSSSDPAGASNRRSSAVGGNINVQATGTSGMTAIQIDNTSQLLSLLENAPTAQGGLIKISASNGNIQVNGTAQADRGGVDVRTPVTATNSQITLNGATLHGDIVKAAALGPGGRLSIGGGTLDANNILRLYATGSNGQITFVANCAIRGGNELSIAANTVRIDDGVMVNVTGHIADVYTNNAQYVGGNNPTTGMFTGLGANTHLGQPPPAIGPPGGN